MENTTQGKKPSEWFTQLKEPYRSEAIANVDKDLINPLSADLCEALKSSFIWSESKQGKEYWSNVLVSIVAGETTYLEPELIGNTDNLKPEQMESGKWYFLDTNNFSWLIKFSEIQTASIYIEKAIDVNNLNSIYTKTANICNVSSTHSIRPATNEEVLKYFPDEKFEPIEKGCPFDENVSLINEVNNTQVTEQQNQKWSEKVELRPEELVSGEVYTLVNFDGNNKFTIQFESYNPKELNPISYKKMRVHSSGVIIEDSICCHTEGIIFHATPQEKALLLGEEETDWKAKFEELQDKYEKMELSYINSIETQDAKYDALADVYSKLELQQNNQEKVYFYIEPEFNTLMPINSIDKGLPEMPDGCNIYEAVKIGVKKSVLVNE